MYNVFWHLTDNIKFIVSWVSVLCRVEKLKNVSTFWGVTEVWNLPFFCYLLHNSAVFVLSATCLTGTSAGGAKKKLRFSWKKTRKNFVSSRNCRTFALAFGKNPGAGLRKGVFRVRMKKRSLTYCKQQQGSSRPFLSGSLGDSKETRYVDFIYNRIQWIPIERRCLGQRTDRFLFQLSDPHTLLYNIYRDSEPKIQF